MLAAVLLVSNRRYFPRLFRDGFRTSYAEMQMSDADPELPRR